jgi:YjjG family noncanonical pyrimidine nucleotidase
MSAAISCLLFDLDNTLLDFDGAAKAALWQTFTDYGTHCSEAIHQTYKHINKQVWTDFERGKISAARLRPQRFRLLFEAIAQNPARPEDFSQRYLENLVLKSEAYQGVSALLDQLRPNYQLGLITNGLREVQRPRLARLQMQHHFQSIVVSDEIGVAKPQAAFFAHAYADLPQQPPKEEVLVIGDNLHSDISGGRDFGFRTCWVSHGRINTSDILPDYTLNQVVDIPNILTS